MNELFNQITKKSNEPKAMMSSKDLTLDVKNDKLKVRIIIVNINIEKPSNDNIWISGSAYVLVSTP